MRRRGIGIPKPTAEKIPKMLLILKLTSMAMVTVSNSMPDLINEIKLTTHFGQAKKANKKQLKLELSHINIAITQASKYEIL